MFIYHPIESPAVTTPDQPPPVSIQPPSAPGSSRIHRDRRPGNLYSALLTSATSRTLIQQCVNILGCRRHFLRVVKWCFRTFQKQIRAWVGSRLHCPHTHLLPGSIGYLAVFWPCSVLGGDKCDSLTLRKDLERWVGATKKIGPHPLRYRPGKPNGSFGSQGEAPFLLLF